MMRWFMNPPLFFSTLKKQKASLRAKRGNPVPNYPPESLVDSWGLDCRASVFATLRRDKSLAMTVLCLLVLATPALAAPPIQEVTSPQGITAWLIEDHTLPLISMRFSFSGGVETDPEDKQGLATLATSLMTQGAGPYDAQTFQDKLSASSIALSLDAGRDYVEGSLKTLSQNKREAFRLLSLALTQPRFDETDFQRLRDQQLVSERFQLADPAWQVKYALFSYVFEGHPYAFRSLGTKESLLRLTRDDIKLFAQSRLAKNNLLVTAVGAMTAKELRQELDAIFGKLPEKEQETQIANVSWPQKAKTICLARNGKQTNVFFTAPMLRRDDPDWYAAQAANYILGGGGFESRLMKEVRAREGLTYGVSTGLAPMEKTSILAGSFAADNDKAQEALALLKRVWQDYYEKGAKDSEIEAAKKYLIGSWPLHMTSTDSMAATLLSIRQEKLGIDYLEKRKQLFQNISKEDVDRVIKKYFDPANISFATIGAADNLMCDIKQNEAEE